MQRLKRFSLLGVLLLVTNCVNAEYSEGKHYSKLSSPIPTQTGDRIEVLEFFWYGCPHCFQFEPTLQKWKPQLAKNVSFLRMPSPLNPRWMVHTKAFYALESMGEGENHHQAIFNAMHVKRQRLYSKDAIADFLASRGIDKQTFLSTFDSFAVEMRARQALQLGQQYQLNGVPMLTVNGKYTISAEQAGSYQAMVNIADYLIRLESK